MCYEIIVICHNLGHPNASLPGRNNCFELFIETVQPSAKEFSDHQKKKKVETLCCNSSTSIWNKTKENLKASME